MIPATAGAREGPAKGVIANIAKAFPLVSASHMSDINALYQQMKGSVNANERDVFISTTHPELERGQAANVPPRKRNTRTDGIFFARAEPT